jgi:shikimate kinase
MNENGVTIWLNESIEKMESRVFNNKSKRPLLNNIADKDLFNYLEELLNSRKLFYSQSTHCLNSGEVLENNLQKIINVYV